MSVTDTGRSTRTAILSTQSGMIFSILMTSQITSRRSQPIASLTSGLLGAGARSQDNTVAQYNWITPNLCDDMHDSCAGNSIAHGDTWLSENVPAILNSAAYQKRRRAFHHLGRGRFRRRTDPDDRVVPFAKVRLFQQRPLHSRIDLANHAENLLAEALAADAGQETDLSDMFTVFP